ncbi:hypothetical protein DEO23_15495 [Brachybacterium endophyticum]|uniref:DUF1795 domain-containing protein n=1 Tax=Brachybacterium endophyticum TaxID=2182385 RepID=A0A2U2RGN5_9MICO|nr:hypothetical protein [Brachybacterium endophyticum]PWH05032.1 hypothetical protein DEO23_15495 [Brachybacterium endophyticum]
MTVQITYPNEDFPPPVGFTLEIPDDWETLAVPGVQMAVAEPRVEGRFRSNVVVTIQRCPAGTPVESIRTSLETRKSALPQLEELGTGELELEGVTWIASEYGYTQPGQRTVVQATRCTMLPRSEHVSDLLEVVGSCGSEHADEQIGRLRAIQDSVRPVG